MIGVNGLVNKAERTKDLEVLITNLDISQTMVDNATEKYQNMAKYLQSKGIDADIYPQGSFAIGTIVRPYVLATERKSSLPAQAAQRTFQAYHWGRIEGQRRLLR